MRLLKEEADMVSMDTAEYKTAIKSVIQCQIQSLLQKLASETGEESIVISTNIAKGTYSHLGSYLGQEYLQDSDASVEMVCQKFIHFCAGMKGNSMGMHNDVLSGRQEAGVGPNHQILKRMLEQNSGAQPISNDIHIGEIASRKRLLDSTLNRSHVSVTSKRHQTQGTEQNSQGEDLTSVRSRMSLLDSLRALKNKGNNSHSQGIDNAVSWIKREPQQNGESTEQPNCENSQTRYCENLPSEVAEKSVQNSHDSRKCMSSNGNGKQITGAMKRKARPFIPLASIVNKFANHAENDIELEADKNLSEGGDNSTGSREEEVTQSVRELPMKEEANHSNQSFNMSDTFGASENLVLSGFYDHDNLQHFNRKSKSSKKQPHSSSKIKAQLAESSPGEPAVKMSDSPVRVVYECHVCHRELSHLTSYRRHMKIHSLDRPHKCPVCGKGFIRKYHCLHHLKKHHMKSDIDISSLGLAGSPGEASYLQGEDGDHTSKAIIVAGHLYNTPLVFDQSAGSSTDFDQSASYMALHEMKAEQYSSDSRSSPGAVSRECSPRSEKVVPNNNYPIPEHLRKIADPDHMGCILCNKNFPSMNSLLRHLYTHSAGQAFFCKICETGFNKKHLYSAHLMTEHGKEFS